MANHLNAALHMCIQAVMQKPTKNKTLILLYQDEIIVMEYFVSVCALWYYTSMVCAHVSLVYFELLENKDGSGVFTSCGLCES